MRLVVYETRKIFDTRSSVVVLSVCVLMAVGLGVVGATVRPTDALDLSQMAAAAVLPFAVVAPILGALAAASDWRTGSIQHTLFIEPRRERIYAAKWCAALAAAVGTSGIAVVLAVLVGVVVSAARGQSAQAGDFGKMLWELAALIVPGCFFGFGLGAVMLSVPLAVTVVLVVELVLDVALSMVPGGMGLYFASASLPNCLTSGSDPLPAMSSCALWIVTPMVLGFLRYLRSEAA